MSKHDDIIHLEHHISRNRHRMSNYERAAQFAPFAALTGYDKVVAAQEIIYDEKEELDEESAKQLNETILSLKKKEMIQVEYFENGFYLTLEGRFFEIIPTKRILLVEKVRIPFDNIRKIKRYSEDE